MKTIIILITFLFFACQKQIPISYYVVEQTTVYTTFNIFGDSAKHVDSFTVAYPYQLPVLKNTCDWYNDSTYRIQKNYQFLFKYYAYEN